jgi:hypothetical protein
MTVAYFTSRRAIRRGIVELDRIFSMQRFGFVIDTQ